jgi:diguanylate cyclase (GGDEF)-like protein/PAS domain S-box-containing protein
MMGYSANEYIQYPDMWIRTTHPADRERVLAEDARTDETGEPFRMEYRKITREGRVIWVRDEAVLVRDAESRPLHWQGIFIDITERRRTEEALRESEHRFRQLFEQSVDALFVHDENGRLVDCNSQACRLLGYTREELLDLTVRDISLDVLAEEEQKAKESEGGTLWQRAMAGTPGTFTLSHEEENRRKDGTTFPVEVRVGSVDYGGRRMILASVRDVTERKRAEEVVRRNEARHRAVLDNAFDAIFTATADGTIRSFNRRAETMFGYMAEEVIGQQLALLMSERRDPRLSGSRRSVEEDELGRTLEVAARRKDGTEFPIELSITEVREGEDVLLTGIVRDITERKVFEAQLTYQALHDPLTHLPNRTLFLDRLEQALAQTRRRQEVTVAVLFMDLDDFKNVNDSLGHEVGDELLKAVGARLKKRLRPGDTAARLGGDEFAILLEDVRSVGDASWVAQRIIEDLKAPFMLMGYEIFFTTSIGISLSASEQDRAEEMLRNADLAMYRAKEKGKASYQVFDSAMYERVLERLSLERDLRRAIRREEFVVHYQPKVLLETGRIFGVEALIRWEHPERGLVHPEEFVPAAEEISLIVPIGRQALEEACRRASEWRERYPDDLLAMVSVNLSASQLQHSNLLDEIVTILQRTGLDPRNLNLEITESVVMSDAPSNTATLGKLRDLGIELAIDDFGTGYSSLSYLKRFPVSYLKIDRSFVEGLREGSDDTAVVSGIIALAHTLEIRVIAEGVETAEQLRILRELGCDMAQGHYFSEPLTHEAVSALLATDPRW